MVNHVLDTQMTGAGTIGVPRVRRWRLIALWAVGVAAAAIVFSAMIGTSDSVAATTPAQADAMRWQALVAREYPGATPAAVAETDRLTALAASYGHSAVLTRSRLAEQARWEATAESYTRSQVTESARLSGLAEHYRGLPAPLQAAADRYQAVADSLK